MLKIDTEGFEYQTLLGATKIFSEKKVRKCIFEFGQTTFDQGNTPIRIKELIESFGYKLNNIVDGDPLFPGGKHAKTAQYAMLSAVPVS